MNQSGASVRPGAKMRAQKHLSTLRDLSTWIFHHLSEAIKSGKDELSTERFEMQRSQLVQGICQAQSQLRQAVTDIHKQTACSKSIVAARQSVASREALLHRCGQSLRKAETLLSTELFKRHGMPRPLSCPTASASVLVADILHYASAVSRCSQSSGIGNDDCPPDDDSALVGAFPPHPHVDLLARSRLFDAAAGRAGAHCRRIQAGPTPPSPADMARPAGPPIVRPPPKRPHEPEELSAPPDAKRPCPIPPLEECLRAAPAPASAPAASAPAAGVELAWWWSGGGDAADLALAAAVPARPAAWRPGDPVLVGLP